MRLVVILLVNNNTKELTIQERQIKLECKLKLLIFFYGGFWHFKTENRRVTTYNMWADLTIQLNFSMLTLDAQAPPEKHPLVFLLSVLI